MPTRLADDTLRCLIPKEPLTRARQRVGGDQDGGYVILADGAIGFVMSYGVGNVSSFERHFVTNAIPAFLFDPTVEQAPLDHPLATFVREGIAAEASRDPPMGTLLDHLARFGLADRRDGLLQMDIEGHEWSVLDSVPAHELTRFRQIVLEAHKLSNIGTNPRFRRVFQKITEVFHLVHVHANNVSGITTFGAADVPNLLELTFARKDIVEVGENRTVFPTHLDFANRPRKADVILRTYPFLPASLGVHALADRLAECAERVERRAAQRPAPQERAGPQPGAAGRGPSRA